MSDVLDDIFNKIDTINSVLYRAENELSDARKLIVELEEYILSIQNLTGSIHIY